ncbi:MAG: hypothetical protein CL862_13955 [Cyanobium sp. NAT70]|nr:hypothetical protein [Cyanobium sp. NAT70]
MVDGWMGFCLRGDGDVVWRFFSCRPVWRSSIQIKPSGQDPGGNDSIAVVVLCRIPSNGLSAKPAALQLLLCLIRTNLHGIVLTTI